jgi:hypothetical protein
MVKETVEPTTAVVAAVVFRMRRSALARGTSPSSIVPVAESPSSMVMVNVSDGSSSASSTVGTSTVCSVTPGSNVTVVVVD